MQINLSIANGCLQFICTDALEPLLREGTASVQRVSHVEWNNAKQGWCADMNPVGGPVLGPFKTRREALSAEHEWLVLEREL